MTRSFMRWPGFKYKAVTLSYDDGVVFDKKLMEILDKNGIKCTFNLNSGRFEKDRRMSREESIEVYKNTPHEVATHGVYHLPLDRIGETMAAGDILNDRVALEEMFGTFIQGRGHREKVRNQIRKNYQIDRKVRSTRRLAALGSDLQSRKCKTYGSRASVRRVQGGRVLYSQKAYGLLSLGTQLFIQR